MRRWVGLGLMLLSGLVLILNCSEKSGGLRFENIPPETFITYGPSWKDTTEYKVHLYWYGKDVDGEITHFQVATVRDLDSLAECEKGENFNWVRTTSGESTFVLVANSNSVYDAASQFLKQVHQVTPWGVFVRAVDNRGEADPCPAAAFFIASTAMPAVKIIPTSTGNVEPVAYFQWEGYDPDGVEQYLKYKYLVIEADSVETNKVLDLSKVPPFSEESEAHRLGKWSKWVPSDSNRVIYDLSAHKGRRFYLFVTAMDQAGGYIPVSLFKTNYHPPKGGGSFLSRFYWRFQVTNTPAGTHPIVNAGFLGTYKSSVSTPVYVFSGAKVKLVFWAFENRRNGQLTDAYRYYFDYEDNTDPPSRWIWTKVTDRTIGNTPEWMVRVPERDGKHVDWVLDIPGPHQFVVETRDLAGTVKTLTLRLDVLGGPDPTKRNILLIDDTRVEAFETRPKNYEDSLDAFWNDVLDGFPVEKVFDTGTSYAKDVRGIIEVLGKATTVIWNIHETPDFQPNTQLLRSWGEYGGFIYNYVKLGGNLIIVGYDAALSCFPWPLKDVQDRRGMSSKSNLPVTLDFTPYPPDPAIGATDTVYHFLWDVLGINTLQLEAKQLIKLIPCGLSGPDWQDTIEIDPTRTVGYTGTVPVYSPYYITSWRGPQDQKFPFRTTPELMFSALCRDDRGQVVNKCGSFVGIYVPASQGYGHVAYLAVDPFFFNQDKMKSVILKLLEKFGEQRK